MVVLFVQGTIALAAGAVAPWTSSDGLIALSQLQHEVWTLEEGMPHNTANALLQTVDGYLWVGTYEGLARFDGVRFVIFDAGNTPAIRSSAIRSLLEDRQHRLWVGTVGGGLTRLDDGLFTVIEELASETIHSMVEDSAGTLWVGTDNGLFRRRREHFEEVSVTGKKITIMALLAIGDYLWIGTRGEGLYRAQGPFGDTGSESLDPELPRRVEEVDFAMVNAIEPDGSGGVWVGSVEGGLVHLAGDSLQRIGSAQGIDDDQIQSLYVDPVGNVWIGTVSSGLWQLSKGRARAFVPKGGAAQNGIYDFETDREGSLWFGSSAGLSRLRRGKMLALSSLEGLGGDFVRVIFEDSANRLWIGADGGGLSRVADGKIEWIGVEEGLRKSSVRALVEESDGTVWAGVYGEGLVAIEGSRIERYSREHGLSSLLIRAMAIDAEGNLLVGSEQGIDIFRDGRFFPLELVGAISVTGLLLDSTQRLWISTYGFGVARVEAGRLVVSTVEDGLASDVVFSVHEDSDGMFWAATQAGLCRLGETGWVCHGEEHGLPSSAIFKILEDEAGRFWMSTSRGILEVARAELDEIFLSGRGMAEVMRYGTADGMRSQQCNGASDPAGFKAHDGRLWFPTADGVVSIDPTAISRNAVAPPVVIEKIVADGVSRLPTGGRIELGPGLDRLEIHYTALSLAVPEKVRFSVNLNGMGAGWVDAGSRRVAYYTNVAPGSYEFEVRAANHDGVWNNEGASIELQVEPFFHETKLFYGLVAFLLVALGGGAQLVRAGRLRRRTLQLEQAVVLRTDEIGKLSHAIEQIAEAVLITDRRGRIEYVNPGFEKLTGYSRSYAVGKTPQLLNSGHHSKDFMAEMWNTILRGETFRGVFVNKKKNGDAFHEEQVISAVKSANGEITHFIAAGRDISEQMRAEAALLEANRKLERLVNVDGLTGIANRRSFDETLDAEWRRSLRARATVSLLMCDVDHFKLYNDRLGHLAGDDCLRMIAKAIGSQVGRPGDLVARYGGEEFAVILPETDSNGAVMIAESIRRSVANLNIVNPDAPDQDRITISIGCHTMIPDTEIDLSGFIDGADQALYRAKLEGRNRYAVAARTEKKQR